jgi:hypothetical protein
MRMPDGNTAALMAYEASEIVITEHDRKIAREDVKDRMIHDETAATFDAFLDSGGLAEWLDYTDRAWLFAAISKHDRIEIGSTLLAAIERYIDAYLDGDGAELVEAEAAQQASEMS